MPPDSKLTAESAQPTKAEQLVVVGASAGGIEALLTLLSSIPDGLAAPMVVAQHIDPTRPSHLEEILQRRTRLRITTVVDRQPLEPGVVFVVPADRHVRITDHDVALTQDSIDRPKPSINLLLTTAATTFGERLIAIILTGRVPMGPKAPKS